MVQSRMYYLFLNPANHVVSTISMSRRLGSAIFGVGSLSFLKIRPCLRELYGIIWIPVMCMMIQNFGVFSVCFERLPAVRTDFSDHARLKDYVSRMEGQLDAHVQEGGMLSFPSTYHLNTNNNRRKSQPRPAPTGLSRPGAPDTKQHPRP